MNPAPPTLSYSGTFDDVAAFFRVSVPTVERWKKAGALSHFNQGRNVMFGTEDIVVFKLAYHVATDGVLPAERAERIRREWQQHMLLRSQPPELRGPLEEFQRRLEQLERLAMPALAA